MLMKFFPHTILLITHKQRTAAYYYTGTIDNQESSQLAVSMCSGEMMSDTVSDNNGGRYAYTCHLQREEMTERTFTLSSHPVN